MALSAAALPSIAFLIDLQNLMKSCRFLALMAPLLFLCTLGRGQSTNAPTNEDYYHWLDRYEVKTGQTMPQLFTTVKPYKRDAIVGYLDSLYRRGVFTSRADAFNFAYFRNDNWEWSRTDSNESRKPILKHFYQKKSDLFFVDLPELDLHVSPVLYLGLGTNRESGELPPYPSSKNLFVNTRGVEVRGMIDRKIGFYTFLSENQMALPIYVQKRVVETKAVPHEGFWKGFKEDGVDFFQARGYIDFNVSKHVYMQLGHDKMFIGNGLRSFIYSDFAPPQLFWRANVKVWKLNYQFQINRMVADVNGNAGGLTAGKYPEKYVAFHHASFNIGRKLNLGFFESIIYSPLDPSNGSVRNSLELNYFNPIIFYRAIEQQYGSSDNAILGADFKWNVGKGVQVYGQFVLDEFLLKEIKARNGWWANKFALQGGAKYIDAFGISNLDVQAEFNMARPFTFSHNTSYGNYSNYRQPIGHPLGANFRELIGIVRYQPVPRLHLVAKAIYFEKGTDLYTNNNYGGDILKDNATRFQEYNNTIGQGTTVEVLLADFTASYMLKHNLFLDARATVRTNKSQPAEALAPNIVVDNTNSTIGTVALRWNIAARNYDF